MASPASVFPKIAGARPVVQAAPWDRGSQVAQTRVTPQTISPMAMKRRHNPALRVPSTVLRAASECTDDPFWVKVLRDAAEGRWPRGFKFKSGSLSFQHKTNLFEEPVSDDMEPQDVCDRIINFIKKRGDRQSDRDRERVTRTLRGSRAPLRERPGDPSDVENQGARAVPEVGVVGPTAAWKYKRGRPALFSRYVEERSRELGLGLRARADLFEAVKFCRGMGWLGDDNITLSSDDKPTPSSILPRLTNIKAIRFTEGKRWEIVPIVSRSYAAQHIDGLTAGVSAELLAAAIGSDDDPARLDAPNIPDMKSFHQRFRDNMKVQSGERFLGSPLQPGEHLHSVRSAHAAAMASETKVGPKSPGAGRGRGATKSKAKTNSNSGIEVSGSTADSEKADSPRKRKARAVPPSPLGLSVVSC